VTLRERLRLEGFDNRVLKRIFLTQEGLKGRRLEEPDNEELQNFFSSPV
jgi:hypothetical protein